MIYLLEAAWWNWREKGWSDTAPIRKERQERFILQGLEELFGDDQAELIDFFLKETAPLSSQ